MRSSYVLATAALAIASMSAVEPPPHPHAVDSPFPMVHLNSYRQASSRLRGPEPGDRLVVSTMAIPGGEVSPWLLLSPRHDDGVRALWGSSSTTIFKVSTGPRTLQELTATTIDADRNDLSWTMCLLGPNRMVTRDDDDLRLYGDDPGDPGSPIRLLGSHPVPPELGTEPGRLARMYDGSLLFSTTQGGIGILDVSTWPWRPLAQASIPRDDPEEVMFHNDCAVDEDGRIYIVTSLKMVCMRWDAAARTLAVEWTVAMDLGGRPKQRSGTTPTLMGVGPDEDRLVLICDSSAPSARMIAFWRDRIPGDWPGLTGFDRRVAGIATLPGCRPPNLFNAAVENSPTCWGYGIAAAQYNGFTGQPTPALTGVYRLAWDPIGRRLENRWTRSDLTINSVLSLSVPSNLVYGSGIQDDGTYVFYGLDWDTGETRIRLPLGTDRSFDDPGNANVIAEDRSVTYCGLGAIVRITPEPRLNQPPRARDQTLLLRPGETVRLTLDGVDPDGTEIAVHSIDGPHNGSLEGAGTIRLYTPAAAATTDTIVYRVTDGFLVSEPATVAVTIAAEDDDDPPPPTTTGSPSGGGGGGGCGAGSAFAMLASLCGVAFTRRRRVPEARA